MRVVPFYAMAAVMLLVAVGNCQSVSRKQSNRIAGTNWVTLRDYVNEKYGNGSAAAASAYEVKKQYVLAAVSALKADLDNLLDPRNPSVGSLGAMRLDFAIARDLLCGAELFVLPTPQGDSDAAAGSSQGETGFSSSKTALDSRFWCQEDRVRPDGTLAPGGGGGGGTGGGALPPLLIHELKHMWAPPWSRNMSYASFWCRIHVLRDEVHAFRLQKHFIELVTKNKGGDAYEQALMQARGGALSYAAEAQLLAEKAPNAELRAEFLKLNDDLYSVAAAIEHCLDIQDPSWWEKEG